MLLCLINIFQLLFCYNNQYICSYQARFGSKNLHVFSALRLQVRISVLIEYLYQEKCINYMRRASTLLGESVYTSRVRLVAIMKREGKQNESILYANRSSSATLILSTKQRRRRAPTGGEVLASHSRQRLINQRTGLRQRQHIEKQIVKQTFVVHRHLIKFGSRAILLVSQRESGKFIIAKRARGANERGIHFCLYLPSLYERHYEIAAHYSARCSHCRAHCCSLVYEAGSIFERSSYGRSNYFRMPERI